MGNMGLSHNGGFGVQQLGLSVIKLHPDRELSGMFLNCHTHYVQKNIFK